MTRFRRTMLTASSAMVLAAILTGCSLASGDVTALIPSAGQGLASDVATPTPTPTPAPDALVGDAVTADTPLADGQRTYAMADGSLVVISTTGPVPDAVLEDAKVGAKAFDTADIEGPAQVKSSIQRRTLLQEKLGGTKTLMIDQTIGFLGSDPAGGTPSPVYTMLVAGKPDVDSVTHDLAAVTQATNDYIASHGGPDAGWKIMTLF